MNYYHLVEDRVRNFLYDKIYLESLYKDMAILELEYQLNGISYDGIGGSTSTSDMTGETAIRLAHKRAEIELKIAKQFKKVQHIETALDNLSNTEKLILNRHYVCSKTLQTISIETAWSLASVKRRKREAMHKMIRQLYGV